jgi:uncharacterized membrane protein YfcA
MLEISIIALFTLLGVITQRVVGFGIAPFLSPVALIFFIPPVAVVTTIFVGTLSCLIILFQTRHHSVVIPKVIARVLLAAIPGLLLGSYIVTRIDKALLQIILGVLVITAILVQEYALPKPTRPLSVTKGISLSGFLTGLLNATAANGAPPMAMWLRTHTSTPDQIRQNLAAMFVVVNLCSLTAIHYMRPQTFSHQIVGRFAVLVPVVIIGNLIGVELMKKINIKIYEKLVVVAIIVTGLVSISIGVASKL